LHSYSEVEDSILFPNVTVGRYACVRNAIIDSGVTIPDGTVIGYGTEIDREHYTVTEGGRIVVTSETVFAGPAADAGNPAISQAGTNL
jgi:glucose-1-phosphate adenylyltransferase